MRYILCQNSQPTSKYFKGKRCYEEVLVDDNAKSVLCWKCTAMLVPPPEEKKSSGYPRGWKFMAEFVDKDGNVYHKGEIQEHLFGTLPPTEIKEGSVKDRKKKETIDDKITTQFSKLVEAGKNKNGKKSVRNTSKTKRRK
jgi:hypothetical protein